MKDFVANLLSSLLILTALGLFVFLQGCSGSADGPPRAIVSGQLTIDGKPVAGVEVNFVNPDFPEHGSYGVTDSEGRYELSVGAVPGLNKVYFSKLNLNGVDLNPEEGMDMGQLEAMSVSPAKKKVETPEQVIPEEYRETESKLTISVPDHGTDEANFEISSRT